MVPALGRNHLKQFFDHFLGTSCGPSKDNLFTMFSSLLFFSEATENMICLLLVFCFSPPPPPSLSSSKIKFDFFPPPRRPFRYMPPRPTGARYPNSMHSLKSCNPLQFSRSVQARGASKASASQAPPPPCASVHLDVRLQLSGCLVGTSWGYCIQRASRYTQIELATKS